jgi:vesicle coat complex subunit
MEHACANSVSTVTDALAGFVSEFITSACEDPVANVRLVAAASLGKIPQCLDDEKSAIVKKTLAKLKATDSDEDVKYAATMALENYE